MSINKRIDRYS